MTTSKENQYVTIKGAIQQILSEEQKLLTSRQISEKCFTKIPSRKRKVSAHEVVSICKELNVGSIPAGGVTPTGEVTKTTLWIPLS